MGKRPTDFLTVSFYVGSTLNRMRFKVMQSWGVYDFDLARNLRITYSGEPLPEDRQKRTSRQNLILVGSSVTQAQFEECLKTSLAEKFGASRKEITLNFQDGNIIKFGEVKNVRKVKDRDFCRKIAEILRRN